MWNALENAALRESLPTPLKAGESVHNILVKGQLNSGRYNIHHLGHRRSKPYRLKQYYALNTNAFLRWQNEARFISIPQAPGFSWPSEEWRGGVIEPFSGGMTLDRWLMETECSLDQRLDIALQIAQQLASLHGASIAHRGLSPTSLRIENRQVTIANFGYARYEPWDDFWSDSFLISEDMTCTSPENLRGETCGYDVDVYAFGSLMYQLLTGAPPFGPIKRSLRPLFPGWIAPAVLSDNSIPDNVRRLTTACMSPPPSHRPQMEEVADTLASTIGGTNLFADDRVKIERKRFGLERDKGMVFIKDDEYALPLFDAALHAANERPSMFLFVGLIPNNLPSGHTERFKGRLFRKMAQGLMRCREAGVEWSLRIFENVDPEQAASEIVQQYQPDNVYIGNSSSKRTTRFLSDFRSTLDKITHVTPVR